MVVIFNSNANSFAIKIVSRSLLLVEFSIHFIKKSYRIF